METSIASKPYMVFVLEDDSYQYAGWHLCQHGWVQVTDNYKLASDCLNDTKRGLIDWSVFGEAQPLDIIVNPRVLHWEKMFA